MSPTGRINLAELGAVAGEDASDAIDIAVSQLLATGGEIFVPDTYRISRTVALPTGVRLVGASPFVSLDATVDFEGDCLVRCARRDVDSANIFDMIGLYHIGLRARSGIVGVDLAGTRRSTLHDVRLTGPGVNVAGSLAIRLSDRAPNGARCSCYFVNMSQIEAGGWEVGIFHESPHQNCGQVALTTASLHVKVGIDFGPQQGSSGFLFGNVYMYGGREPGSIGIRGTLPYGTRLIGVDQDLFETIHADVRALDFVQDTVRARRFLIREGLQWSATNTPDTAARPGEGIGQTFAQRSAAFVVIPAGRKLIAGVNHFTYWFGSGTPGDILGVQPISGLQQPLQFTARLDTDTLGVPCRLQVIAPEATTLAEELLLMVYRLHVGGR